MLSKCEPPWHNRRQEVGGGNAGVWSEGERWSLLQWTLGEFKKLSNLNETKLFIKHPLGVRKILKSYFFKNNWTSPPTLCFCIFVWCQDFWNLILSNFVKINFEKMLPLEYSSSIIHLSINPDAKYLKFLTSLRNVTIIIIINLGTIFNTPSIEKWK